MFDKLYHTRSAEKPSECAGSGGDGSGERDRRAQASDPHRVAESFDSSKVHTPHQQPHEPNTPKPSRRIARKRESLFLKNLSVSEGHAKMAIDKANMLVTNIANDDDDDDRSETSSEYRERIIIDASNRLAHSTFHCL